MIDKLQQAGHLAGIAAGIRTGKSALRGPLWVQIGVSNRCNYRCVMCWDHPSFVPETDPYPDEITSRYYNEHPEIDREHAVMEMPLFEKTIGELHALGTRRVELVGRGEPLLNRDLPQMVTALKAKKMYASIATNGSLLKEDILESLVREGIDRIIVSMNAGRPETYGKIHTTEDERTFERVKDSLLHLKGLKAKLRSESPFLTLSFVLCEPNSGEASDMLDLAVEVGAAQIIFKHAILYEGIDFLDLPDGEKVRLDNELIALEVKARREGIDLKLEPPIGHFRNPDDAPPSPMQVYGKIPCSVGWLFALITADGTVLPCCHCFSPMGNVQDRSFAEIWRSRAYRDFRRATMSLPARKRPVTDCRCDICAYLKLNLSVHNLIHPFHQKTFSQGQREYSLKWLLASVLGRGTTRGAEPVTRRGERPVQPGHSGDADA